MKNTFGTTAKLTAYFKKQIASGATVKLATSEHIDGETDFVYIIDGFLALKFPKAFYLIIAQPFTLRECPEQGIALNLSNGAPDSAKSVIELWDSVIKNALSDADATPYLQDVFGKKGKYEQYRIFSINGKPVLLNQKYLDCFEWRTFEYVGSGATSAIVGKSSFIECIIMPFCPIDKTKKIDESIASLFHEQKES